MPTKTTRTAAYAAVVETTATRLSRAYDAAMPLIKTKTVVVMRDARWEFNEIISHIGTTRNAPPMIESIKRLRKLSVHCLRVICIRVPPMAVEFCSRGGIKLKNIFFPSMDCNSSSSSHLSAGIWSSSFFKMAASTRRSLVIRNGSCSPRLTHVRM